MSTVKDTTMGGAAAGEAQTVWWWENAAVVVPDHSELYYLKFTVLVILFYQCAQIVSHLACTRNNQLYREMTWRKQTEYRLYIMSIINAFVCVVLSVWAMWFVCGDGKTVFNSDQCIRTVRYVHIWALLNCCGYFSQDFIWLFFVMKGRSSLDYQTYAHHIVATTTFYQTLYFMDFCCVFGVMLLFTEISTPFVNIRWFLFTHEATGSIWYAINSIAAFFVFFFGRIIFQFYICYDRAIPLVWGLYNSKTLGVYQAFVVSEMGLMVILSIVLNSYWFWLMCKMIIRLARRALSTPKDDTEHVQLVEADQLKDNSPAEAA